MWRFLRERRDKLAVSGLDWAIHMPWYNRHRPFVALHVIRWGSDVYQGRSRNIYHVGVQAGRLFTDSGGARWFDISSPWWRR